MGLLTLFGRGGKPGLKRLINGSFTVDATGRVVSSTVPGSVSESELRDIGRQILAIFDEGGKLNLGFTELVVQYVSFKITARQMRGGAIIFLSPKLIQTAAAPSNAASSS
jgi:hypothetical protein